jgi:hypothetical protein
MSFLIVSLVASALFVVLVLAAHVLNPEISPRWRMLSELSIGRLGWVMDVAFVVWAVSNLALAVALWRLAPAWVAALLMMVAIGPLGAAFATADPITTPPEQASTHGRWHTAFAVLFVLGFPLIAAVFVITSMTEASPLWPWFLGMAIPVWVTLALFIAMVARWQRTGRSLGPEMPIGIPNRVFVVAYVAWTVAIALAAWPLSGSR